MAKVDFSHSEICDWLKVICESQNFEVNILGTSDKGDGQCGEVLFVEVTTKDSLQYHLALKCSKSNSAIMAQSPVIRDAFRSEIYFYETIVPTFRQFQIDRGVTDPFDSVPRYFGKYSDESKDVIALENAKHRGYKMWDPCTPLTRRHIDLVVSEYAKFHAISIAMKELQPEAFQKLIDGFSGDIFRKLFRSYSREIYFKNIVEEVHNLLKDDLDADILKNWLGFKEQIHIAFDWQLNSGLEVITHGDCWSNNFMYKYENGVPTQVNFLDWQMCRISSPISDLSYFLFACISDRDVGDMDNILHAYYESLLGQLSKMGSHFGRSYTLDKFLEQWQQFSRFGLVMSITLIKASYLRRSNDKIEYKNRLKPIVKYAVESDLV